MDDIIEDEQNQISSTPIGIPSVNSVVRSKKDFYEYINLGDIRTPGVFNFYGIVTFFHEPRRVARGTDVMLTFVIVDPSLPEGMIINIFAETIDKLPKITHVGDIFRAHRIKVNLYASKFTGMGSRNGGFAYLVIDVFGNAHFSSKTVTFDFNDKERTKALKVWWEGTRNFLHSKSQNYAQLTDGPLQIHESTSPLSLDENSIKYRKMFNEVQEFPKTKPFPHIDIVCQIVSLVRIATFGEGVQRNMVIACCDGTGQKSFLSSDSLAQVYVPPPPPSTFRIFDSNLGFGSLFNVVIWTPKYFEEVHQFQPGRWILLRNVQANWYAEHWELKVESNSQIVIIANEEQEDVQNLIKLFKENCDAVKKIASMVALNETLPKHSISTISKSDTGRFHCEAKVKEIIPSNYRNITRAFCKACDYVKRSDEFHNLKYIPFCKKCSNPMLDFIYMFQMLLEDETGTLKVIVYKEDGERFFFGYPACNLYENVQTYQALAQKIETLIGGLWIDCCIKSYLTKNRERKFRIFDTRCLV